MNNFIMILTLLMPHLEALKNQKIAEQENGKNPAISAQENGKKPAIGMTKDELLSAITPSRSETGTNFYSGREFERFYFEGGTCRSFSRSCVAELEDGRVIRVRE